MCDIADESRLGHTPMSAKVATKRRAEEIGREMIEHVATESDEEELPAGVGMDTARSRVSRDNSNTAAPSEALLDNPTHNGIDRRLPPFPTFHPREIHSASSSTSDSPPINPYGPFNPHPFERHIVPHFADMHLRRAVKRRRKRRAAAATSNKDYPTDDELPVSPCSVDSDMPQCSLHFPNPVQDRLERLEWQYYFRDTRYLDLANESRPGHTPLSDKLAILKREDEILRETLEYISDSESEHNSFPRVVEMDTSRSRISQDNSDTTAPSEPLPHAPTVSSCLASSPEALTDQKGYISQNIPELSQDLSSTVNVNFDTSSHHSHDGTSTTRLHRRRMSDSIPPDCNSQKRRKPSNYTDEIKATTTRTLRSHKMPSSAAFSMPTGGCRLGSLYTQTQSWHVSSEKSKKYSQACPVARL